MDVEKDGLQETELPPRKKKGKKIIIFVLALVFVLSLAGNAWLFVQYRSLNRYIDDMATNYSESYFYFDSLTVDSFKKKVASGEEFIVLITRPNCSNCVRMERPFIELAEQQGISDKIYHLNVVLLRQDNEAWALFKETYGFEGTPTYARFVGGENVSCVGWTYDANIDMELLEAWIGQQSDYFGQ